MIKIINGNVFNAFKKTQPTILVHQVNCKGVMGAGIAAQIRKQFPHVYDKYRELVFETKDNPSELLGTVQLIPINNKYKDCRVANAIPYNEQKYICNLFGQNECRYGKKNTDIESFEIGMQNLANAVSQINLWNNTECIIAIPYKIGCGLGGADWDKEIFPIIKHTFSNDFLVEIYKLDI